MKSLFVVWMLLLWGCDQSTTRPSRTETKVQTPTQTRAPRSPRQFVSSVPPSADRVAIGNWLDVTAYSGSRITIFEQGGTIYADQIFTYDGSGRTLALRESKSDLGRRFDQIKDTSEQSDEPRAGTKATKEGREFARVKLVELDKFKSSAKFHEYGFAIGGPFNAWLKEVEAKSDDRQLTVFDKLAAANLSALGLEYLRSRGRETDFSRMTRREIVETIESGSIDTEAHDYWIINASGDLEWHDKDGLFATAKKTE